MNIITLSKVEFDGFTIEFDAPITFNVCREDSEILLNGLAEPITWFVATVEGFYEQFIGESIGELLADSIPSALVGILTTGISEASDEDYIFFYNYLKNSVKYPILWKPPENMFLVGAEQEIKLDFIS